MKRPPFPPSPCEPEAHAVLARVSPGYPPHQVRLLTCYAPVRRSAQHPKALSSLDLHVLGTPPAFVLSQDQTLQKEKSEQLPRTRLYDAIRKLPLDSPRARRPHGRFPASTTQRVHARGKVHPRAGPTTDIQDPGCQTSTHV